MSATIHKFPIRKPREYSKLDYYKGYQEHSGADIEILKRIAFELREADRELCEDLDNWEREMASIVPRDYKEEE